MDFKKKQKSEATLKEFFLRAAAFFVVFIFIVLVVADVKIYQKRKGLEREVAKYEQQIQQLKEKNKDLENRISNSDNLDYIEKVAREEQDMQKPGENVVSFVMPEGDAKKETAGNMWDAKNWFSWLSNSWEWIKKVF